MWQLVTILLITGFQIFDQETPFISLDKINLTLYSATASLLSEILNTVESKPSTAESFRAELLTQHWDIVMTLALILKVRVQTNLCISKKLPGNADSA
jgi:hypothetical protein